MVSHSTHLLFSPQQQGCYASFADTTGGDNGVGTSDLDCSGPFGEHRSDPLRSSPVRIRPVRSSRPSRTDILKVIAILLVAHFAEIGLYAGVLFICQQLQLGALAGEIEGGAIDWLYVSISSYTTLGVGDLHPRGTIETDSGRRSAERADVDRLVCVLHVLDDGGGLEKPRRSEVYPLMASAGPALIEPELCHRVVPGSLFLEVYHGPRSRHPTTLI
jgi:hypothetical protein